jgi:hypothetical protein
VAGQGAKFSFFLPWIMPTTAPAVHND